jgi:hypothetical protein
MLRRLGADVVEVRKPACGAFAEPSDGLEPSIPSLPCALGGNWWQAPATVCNVLSGRT